MKNKYKIVENKGITGMGTDYNVYILSGTKRVTVLMAGFMIGFIASYIYFDNQIVSIIVGALTGVFAIPVYTKKLFNDRKKELRIQFRDLLESLSNSYTVGMTSIRAFHAAYSDMIAEHGENSYITNEVRLICAAHDNRGIEIKDMLNDFAERSGLEDVRSFAGVFQVSSELGGDVAKVIRETRDMIGDKIETELEIQTMVTAQKNQLNVLAVMPIVMSLLTKSFNTDTSGEIVLSNGMVLTNGMIVILIKIIAMGLFIFAYWLGTKIVDIKV